MSELGDQGIERGIEQAMTFHGIHAIAENSGLHCNAQTFAPPMGQTSKSGSVDLLGVLRNLDHDEGVGWASRKACTSAKG